MESLVLSSSIGGFLEKNHKVNSSVIRNGSRKAVIMAAKKNSGKKKEDRHSFVAKPDETTGLFPESVLLKQKVVEQDGKLVPEFADAQEQELYEALNLMLESDLDVERVRYYEVVYLIHHNFDQQLDSINHKIQDFVREKKGRVNRVSDWGLRRLAYKIQKANKAHYMLMNFEMEAKFINEFKSMLDSDERIIRHLVMKQDEAISEECPPPPEFHTLRADMDDDDDDDEDEMDPGIIYVDDEEYLGDQKTEKDAKPTTLKIGGRRKLKAEKLG